MPTAIPGLNTGVITNMTVAQTAVQLPATPNASRKSVRIWNPTGNQTVYVGYSAAVVAGAPVAGQAQGVPITAGSVVTFSVGLALLYAISASGSNVVQVEELG